MWAQIKHRFMCLRLGICSEHLALRGWCMQCFEKKLAAKHDKNAEKQLKRHQKISSYIIKYRKIQ